MKCPMKALPIGARYRQGARSGGALRTRRSHDTALYGQQLVSHLGNAGYRESNERPSVGFGPVNLESSISPVGNLPFAFLLSPPSHSLLFFPPCKVPPLLQLAPSLFFFSSLAISVLLFICLIICPWAQLFPLPHSSAKCFPAAFNSLLFCSFLLSFGSCCCCLSYLFFHLPGIHFSVQQCSSCLSCYTLTYFSILLCYFSLFSFPTLLFFQVTSNLHDSFSWKSCVFFSQPSQKCFLSLLIIAKVVYLKMEVLYFHHYHHPTFILSRTYFYISHSFLALFR